MATYYSSRVNSVAPFIPARGGLGVVAQTATFTVATALGASDKIKLFKLPAGAVVLDFKIASGGTQGGNSDAVFTVGDTGDTDRFITTAGGLALRSGGGVNVLNNPVGLGHQYTSETDIEFLITTAGTGQTTGGYVDATIVYSMEL